MIYLHISLRSEEHEREFTSSSAAWSMAEYITQMTRIPLDVSRAIAKKLLRSGCLVTQHRHYGTMLTMIRKSK